MFSSFSFLNYRKCPTALIAPIVQQVIQKTNFAIESGEVLPHYKDSKLNILYFYEKIVRLFYFNNENLNMYQNLSDNHPRLCVLDFIYYLIFLN